LNSKFSNLSNIYLNNQKEDEINNSTIDQQEYKKIMSKKINIMNIINIFLYFISILFFILAIFMGYKFYKNNILSKQNYILILIILTYFIGLFLRIANILPNLLSYTGYAINSFKYFKDLFKDNKINKNNIKINSGTLKIENLTYYYEINNEKKYIFNNINLEINSGERVAIYGRSGFGKSTLAKLIMNLYKYDGKIFLDNNDIKFMNDNILRSNIIYINQKTELFEDTIFENIRYGNKISNDDIINIINKYELNNIFENLKQNYNTNCGVRGNNLSLGMQKIIILLRAYFKFKESKVIIFDEPLAGLDYHTKKKILKFISEIEKDKTIIIITHDEEIFSIVDRKINIENISLSS
jgi:ATP-binding cassette subfamily B protein